ncbi:hypothetical protein BIY22_13040 [Vibrio panuliri]|uniref:Acetyltransferase n=1 Tax=Vibrio panuliri TaxID=1381081 RepID=A0A1Q9HAM4_9VIBR|nr:CatB-related O-acetyltransferase [Vibrio panuliri]OLQ86169.1 hypothetical protein BIY22_13040 [Vibrio panuliri]
MDLKNRLDYFLPEIFKSFIYWFLYKYRYRGIKIKSGTKLSRNVRIEKGVEIGKNVSISGSCNIGGYTFINDYAMVDMSVISIGRFCSISHNVKIGMRSHPINLFSTSPNLYFKSKNICLEDYYKEKKSDIETSLGNDVYIGANAIIMAGVSVGDGAVIGAGSIVTKNVSPYSIVVGNPGKVIGHRFSPEIIDEIISMNIFESSLDDIIRLNHKFNINMELT